MVVRSVERSCSDGERVLALLAVSRLRRAVSVLAVTQDRLATFGFADDGYPLVDEVFLPALTELSVAGGFLRAGEVRARCGRLLRLVVAPEDAPTPEDEGWARGEEAAQVPPRSSGSWPSCPGCTGRAGSAARSSPRPSAGSSTEAGPLRQLMSSRLRRLTGLPLSSATSAAWSGTGSCSERSVRW